MTPPMRRGPPNLDGFPPEVNRSRHVALRARFVEAALAQRKPSSALLRPFLLVAGACFAAATAVAIGTHLRPHVVRGVPSSSPTVPAATAPVLPDGSTVVLAAGARGAVRAVTASGATIVLDEGTATLDIVHRPGTSWRVLAGPFEVVIVGTAFDVSWLPVREELHIVMRSGTVRVTGPGLGSGRDVGVGEPVSFSARATAEEPRATTTSTAHHRPLPRAAASSERTAESSWTELVDRGEQESVVQQAEAAGLPRVLSDRGDADLAALADAARFTGRTALAREVLLTTRRRFAGSGRAAVSAFLLGKLDEDAGADRQAAAWFERYLDEAPRGALAADASIRALQAWRRSGDQAAVRRAAADYLRRFPTGALSDVARESLAP